MSNLRRFRKKYCQKQKGGMGYIYIYIINGIWIVPSSRPCQSGEVLKRIPPSREGF